MIGLSWLAVEQTSSFPSLTHSQAQPEPNLVSADCENASLKPISYYGKTKLISENLIKNYKKANLILDKIPFPDSFFSSVSAYDFIEHIPRQQFINEEMQYPFIKLMNEIYRVLKPNGLFFASTPVYPHPDTFVDPTHVNYITDSTHHYFISDKNNNILGMHYGFKGSFKEKKVLRIRPNLMEREYRNKFAMYFEWYKRKFRGRFSHLIWELEAIKM